MDIREWFGYEGNHKPLMKIDNQLDQLLVLFAKGLTQYFGFIPSDFQNANALVQKARCMELRPVDFSFLHWLEEKGLPYLKSLCSKELPDDKKLISQLEYEEFNLEEEIMDDESTELRSCLINIVSYLPDRIARANEQNRVVQKYSNAIIEGKKNPYVEEIGVCPFAGSFIYQIEEDVECPQHTITTN